MQITILTAFVSGFFTFFASCFFSILPLYFSYIAGESINNLNVVSKKTLVFKTLLFVLGFSFVFIIFGSGLYAISALLNVNTVLLFKVTGVVLIILGLYYLDFFSYFKLPNFNINFTPVISGYFGPFVLGGLFSIIHIPCIGPVLASILFLASLQSTYYQGLLLLIVFNLGLALPFVFFALFFDFLFTKAKKHYVLLKYLKLFFGLFLILSGVLIIFNKYGYVVETLNLLILQTTLANFL